MEECGLCDPRADYDPYHPILEHGRTVVIVTNIPIHAEQKSWDGGDKCHAPSPFRKRGAKFTHRDGGEDDKCIMQMCLHKWAYEDGLTNEKCKHFRNGKHAMLLALGAIALAILFLWEMEGCS